MKASQTEPAYQRWSKVTWFGTVWHYSHLNLKPCRTVLSRASVNGVPLYKVITKKENILCTHTKCDLVINVACEYGITHSCLLKATISTVADD